MKEKLANELFKNYFPYRWNPNPKWLKTNETCFFLIPKGEQSRSYALLQDLREDIHNGIGYTKYTFRLYDGDLGSTFQLAASCPLYKVEETDPYVDRTWEGLDSRTGTITFFPWKLGEQLQNPQVSQIGVEIFEEKEIQTTDISFAVKTQDIPFVLKVLNQGKGGKRRIFTLDMKA
ncbi:hypothetical protein [Turicimonas sp. TL08]